MNAPDNARYVITREGFQLVQNGNVVVSESAVEVGPAAEGQSPEAPAAATVVLGSAAKMGGSHALGYGTEEPSVISMGSCANAISRIRWENWGSPVTHGSGEGCVQVGEPPWYALMASDLGMCHGVLAYRALRIGNGGLSHDICDG